MTQSDYTIKTMTRQELDIAVAWAAAEGWNPGRHDADSFYAADPSGFLIGYLGNEPIASISAVKYGDSFGFIGFYIVRPEYRGRGYGIQIWNAAMAYLSGRTIGLDGVLAQQENYQKSGFTLAYRNIRYQGTGGGERLTDSSLVPLSTIPFDEVCAYDRPFFHDNRTSFLKSWIAQPESIALGVLGADANLAGYGVIRPCQSGFKIGPLFADSPQLAEDLFLALKAGAPGEAPVFLDIPEVNPAAQELVQRHTMVSMFETARMYTQTCAALPINRLFGVTSFELG